MPATQMPSWSIPACDSGGCADSSPFAAPLDNCFSMTRSITSPFADLVLCFSADPFCLKRSEGSRRIEGCFCRAIRGSGEGLRVRSDGLNGSNSECLYAVEKNDRYKAAE